MALDADAVAEVSGELEATFRRAGCDSSEPVSMGRLFRSLGLDPPERAPIKTEACLARVGGRWRVYVAKHLPVGRARWRIGHELGHIVLQKWARFPYAEDDIEERCDLFGAMACAPDQLVKRARRRFGDDVPELAKRLKVPQSLALLRIAETYGEPAAVVRAAGPIVRGDDYVWPVPLELRKVRACRHPSIATVEINDEPRRVGLMVG